MKQLTDSMKRVTAKYAKALKLAETVRAQELEVDNNILQGRYTPEQEQAVIGVLARNRKKCATVTSNILKKSIDNV